MFVKSAIIPPTKFKDAQLDHFGEENLTLLGKFLPCFDVYGSAIGNGPIHVKFAGANRSENVYPSI